MNKATKICTINGITSINFYLANIHQIENDGISIEHGTEKFQLKSLSFSLTLSLPTSQIGDVIADCQRRQSATWSPSTPY